LEEGVVDAPAGDGGAVDMDYISDLLIGVAAEEEVDAMFCSAESTLRVCSDW